MANPRGGDPHLTAGHIAKLLFAEVDGSSTKLGLDTSDLRVAEPIDASAIRTGELVQKVNDVYAEKVTAIAPCSNLSLHLYTHGPDDSAYFAPKPRV